MFGKLFSRKSKQDGNAARGAILHGVDPEMNYCPICGDEYRAESLRCVSCECELISGKEKLTIVLEKEKIMSGRSMELSPDDDLVTLRKGSLKDIKQLQKLLAAERIPSVVAGDENSCGKGCCGSEMYLQVKKEDAESAMIILAKDHMKNTALAGHDLAHADAIYVQEAEQAVCPACGCQFTPGDDMSCPECELSFG